MVGLSSRLLMTPRKIRGVLPRDGNREIYVVRPTAPRWLPMVGLAIYRWTARGRGPVLRVAAKLATE